jgi:Ca-activated chloride channel family protein
MLLVDLSGSMETADFTNAAGETVQRLDAVKEVLDGFLTRREGDRVGLIVFGNAAFVQVPFTSDLAACRLLLEEAAVRMAGPRTAFGDAIGLAITLLERSEVADRVIIALTDGNDTGSSVPPPEASRIAADRGVTIHVVGVGDPAASGEQALDEEALRGVAAAAGGRYFHAADRAELEAIYAELDRLDTREIETESWRPRRELFQWPLGGFLVLGVAGHAWTLLGRGWRGRVAQTA